MTRKNGWRIFLPVIITVKVAVIVFLITGWGSSKDPVVIEKKKVAGYKSVDIPDFVAFAGEPAPLGRFDVKEAFDRELLVNSYFHSQTLRLIKLAPRYFNMIEPILKEKGIPDDFKYLAVAESGLNPRAVSPAGAVGLWQFLRGTAREYGLEVNSEVDERYHIEKSTYAACDYMLEAFKKYGNWTMVAASFNAGMNGISRQIERQKNCSYYNLLLGQETQRYVFRILALKLILEDPAKYNFDVPEKEKYPDILTKEIKIYGRVDNFADFAHEQGINYKLLKDFNPWLRDNYLTNKYKREYTIKIPVLNNKEGL
jgi:membrane-bound lytic murein transglycosylase D